MLSVRILGFLLNIAYGSPHPRSPTLFHDVWVQLPWQLQHVLSCKLRQALLHWNDPLALVKPGLNDSLTGRTVVNHQTIDSAPSVDFFTTARLMWKEMWKEIYTPNTVNRPDGDT